jgi:uncharacterized protein
VRAWIDVENPPQVQYLTPFKGAFESAGAEVVLTARDYGETYALLRGRGLPFTPVGSSYGRERWRKALGLVRRTVALGRVFPRGRRPDLVVHAGRAAPLAARRLGAASFALCDYEYSHMGVDRVAGSYVLFPEAIDRTAFLELGFAADRLLPFQGLKEDITFAELDLDGIPAHDLPHAAGDGLVRVFVRPPAEESHYYREESGALSLQLLEFLARRDDAVVVFSPRYRSQAEYLARFSWKVPPVVLHEAVPIVSLLKAVDLVISAGGTMIREAAYLGVPAYSTFRGEQGGVDRRLEALGRLEFIASADDFERLQFAKRGPLEPLRSNPKLLSELVETMLERASRR